MGWDGMGWDGMEEGLKGKEVAAWGGTYNWKTTGRAARRLRRPSDCEGKRGLPWFPKLAVVLGGKKGPVSLLPPVPTLPVLPFCSCSCSEAMVCHAGDYDNSQWLPSPAFLDSADSVPGKGLGEMRNEAKLSCCQGRGSEAKDWRNIERVHKWHH